MVRKPTIFNSNITDGDTGEEAPAIELGPMMVAPDFDAPGRWIVWYFSWQHGRRHVDLTGAVAHLLRLADQPQGAHDAWCVRNGDQPHEPEEFTLNDAFRTRLAAWLKRRQRSRAKSHR
jgi:hypothetical protein